MRGRWVCSFLLSIAGAVLMFSACGEDGSRRDNTSQPANATAAVPFTGSLEEGLPTQLPDVQPRKATLAFLSPLAANESLKVIAEAMRLETQRLGGEFIELDANLDVDKQVAQFEQLIARRVDGIAILPLDDRALRPVLEKAAQAGIPVVGSEVHSGSLDPVPGYAVDVWERRDSISYLQARATAGELPRSSKVAVIESAVPVPTVVYAVERLEHWLERFGLEVIGRGANPSDDIAGGEQAMTKILSQDPDVEGVAAYNEESAVGAAAAARAAGRRDLVLTGVNGGSLGFAAVQDERIHATVLVDEVGVGKRLADALYALLEDPEADLPPVVVTGKPRLLTKATAERIPTWSDQLERLAAR